MSQQSPGPSAGFRVFYAVFVLAGLALYAALIPDFPLTHFREAALFVALIVVADMAQITLPRGGASISASSPLDLAGIVLLGASAMVGVEVVAALFSLVVVHRRPLVRVVFNVALIVVTVSASATVWNAFPEAWHTLHDGRFLVPLTAAAVAYYLVNTLSISTIIGLETRRNIVEVWRHNHLWNFFHAMAFVPIAAIVVLVYRAWGPWTLLLFLVPIWLARYSFRLYLEMKEAHINTVAALTSAIDANDPFTHGHSYRVSRYALRIGRALGLSERDLEILEYGALLHDIGKIAIRHDILMKPGRLTEQEFLTLKQHPVIGADIVENLRFLREAAVLVRYHHEQPNGKGYPEGLKGDEIPLGARIILCVDAFDAMTSDRPYRRGLSIERVVEQFEKYKGEQFDLEIANLMLDLIRRGEFPLIVENDPTTAIYESLREHL